MEPPVSSIKILFDHVEAYAKATIELYRLKLIEKTTLVVTSLISQLAVVVVMSLFIVVLTVGVALWIGELLGKAYYGFFVVAGFYLTLGLLFHFFLRKWLRKSVGNMIIKEAFD